MTRRASGLGAWLLQRISAVYLTAFLLLMGAWLWISPPASSRAWQERVGEGWVSVALLLFFLALLVHAWVGVRDILMDYARPLPLRLGLLVLAGTGLAACGVWAARVVLLGGSA